MNLNNLSFCCVVKNEERYIQKLIQSILDRTEGADHCEFIFVDDNSKDATYKILQKYADEDSRFKLIRNKLKGKVAGTNLAVSMAKNAYIKFIDGDDLIEGNLKNLPSKFQCLYHDYNSLNKNKIKYIKIGNWITNSNEIQTNFRSIPKAMFIFERLFLTKYFPIPESLPFEDLWINLIAAESNDIEYYEDSIYIYRQHSNQFYGSLDNFNNDKKIKMANRFIEYFDYLESNRHPFEFSSPKPIIRKYAEVLLSGKSIHLLKLIFSPRFFLKALVFQSSFLTRFIWKIK